MSAGQVRDDWRLTPRETLFCPPERDVENGTSLPPSVIASDDIMRRLASGQGIDEGSLVTFASLLAQAVSKRDTEILDGFGDLESALNADYAYYDADEHLEGFCEGAVYGMVRIAEVASSYLDGVPDSCLPPSVLVHPDVLLAACETGMADVPSLAKALGAEEEYVDTAVSALSGETMLVRSAFGSRWFVYPTRRGERHADALRRLASQATGCGGDEDAAVRRAMSFASFADEDAVRRMLRIGADVTPDGKEG